MANLVLTHWECNKARGDRFVFNLVRPTNHREMVEFQSPKRGQHGFDYVWRKVNRTMKNISSNGAMTMQRPAKKIDSASVQRATAMTRSMIETMIRDVERAQIDPEKDQRKAKGTCIVCYYIRSGLAGQAITSQPCGICHKDQMYGSTNTDALCLECATEHQLCKHCGADIKLRPLRVIKLPTQGKGENHGG
jgi:hypothetical protein